MRSHLIEATFDVKFSTRRFSTGAPFTLAGTPVISAYVGNSTTQITAGITLTVDFDGVTGLNNVRVVATAANGYTADTDVALVITVGTVDSVSVVGEVVGEFTLSRPAPVNVFQVSSDATAADNAEAFFDGTGYAGTGNVIPTVTTLTNLPSITANWLTAAGIADGAIDAATFSSGAINVAALASDAVTEIRSLASGTADSGTTTTMVDAARTEADTDYWVGSLIVFTSGTISGQARYITGFNAATDTITFAPAATQAVGTNTYEIWPTADFLRPTTSGRTLDVSSGGEAGVDWANVGTPGSAVNLSATTTNLVNTLTTYTGNTPQTGDSFLRLTGTGAVTFASLTVSGATALTGAFTATNASNSVIGVALHATQAAYAPATPAQVNTEVLDVLNVDTFTEPGQEAPAATNTIFKMIRYLFKFARNKLTQTSTELKVYADDGTTVDQKATVSDDGTTLTRGELGSGP